MQADPLAPAHPHPHLQPLIVFNRLLSPVEADQAISDLRRRWLHVTDTQGRYADLHAGFKADPITLFDGACRAVSAYMTKGSESWTLGAELCRGDAKRSRSETTFAPFDLARYAMATGDMSARFAWREFERASRGVKSLRYTRGLKGLMEYAATNGRIVALVVEDDDDGPDIDPTEQEETDEVADKSQKQECKLSADTWNWCRDEGLLDGLLRVVETCADGDAVNAVRLFLGHAGADDHIVAGVKPPFAEPMTTGTGGA